MLDAKFRDEELHLILPRPPDRSARQAEDVSSILLSFRLKHLGLLRRCPAKRGIRASAAGSGETPGLGAAPAPQSAQGTPLKGGRQSAAARAKGVLGRE